MNKESAIKIIKNSFKTMRDGSNQYGVPEWKFRKVTDSITRAENALAYFEVAQKNGETEPSTSDNTLKAEISLQLENLYKFRDNNYKAVDVCDLIDLFEGLAKLAAVE